MKENDDYQLTNENYYSDESNMRYMSVHQYLSFVGHMGVRGCEAKAMAMLRGEWEDPTTNAMLIGSYVDAYFEGTIDEFIKKHPEMFATVREFKLNVDEIRNTNPELFTKSGNLKSEWSKVRLAEKFPQFIHTSYDLKSEFKKANRMIERCEEDEFFMQTMSGEKQRIMTADLFGCEWKIKMDSYIPDVAIVDLKTTSDLHKAWRVADYGYASVVEYWAYTLQLALYQKVVEINTGKKLPCYLSFVTKDEEPEICVVFIDQEALDHALNEIEMNMPSVLAVKNGQAEPIRCEKCDYCKRTMKLEEPIHFMSLISE